MNETYRSTKPNEWASHDGNTSASFKPPASHYPISKNLLHMFSNGRINSASRFFSVLNERLHSPLPLYEMLYDSCPIKGTYWKDHRAMIYSLSKDIISQKMSMFVIHIIPIMLHAEMTCELENPSTVLRWACWTKIRSAGKPERRWIVEVRRRKSVSIES
jgi:hypothetical protein